MATTTAICDSFKSEILKKGHDFTATTGDVFKMALLKAVASTTGTYGHAFLNAGTPGSGSPTTSNIGTDELANGSGYATNGYNITAANNITPIVNGGQGVTTPGVNPNWTSATFTSSATVLYNSSASNKAVGCYDFGGDKSVSSGTFTLVMPANTASNALVQIQ